MGGPFIYAKFHWKIRQHEDPKSQISSFPRENWKDFGFQTRSTRGSRENQVSKPRVP